MGLPLLDDVARTVGEADSVLADHLLDLGGLLHELAGAGSDPGASPTGLLDDLAGDLPDPHGPAGGADPDDLVVVDVGLLVTPGVAEDGSDRDRLGDGGLGDLRGGAALSLRAGGGSDALDVALDDLGGALFGLDDAVLGGSGTLTDPQSQDGATGDGLDGVADAALFLQDALLSAASEKRLTSESLRHFLFPLFRFPDKTNVAIGLGMVKRKLDPFTEVLSGP